jgi:hypothetical protein
VPHLQVRDPARVAWLSQTTLSVQETAAVVAKLRERFPALVDPPSDDICYAAQNRQLAVRAIAGDCDLMLVVGSANSHNSSRLVQVACAAGAPAAYLIGSAADIDPRWLHGVSTVGVSSGASTPESRVKGVLAWLAEHGFSDVREVRAAREHKRFALPPELRRDLRQAATALNLRLSHPQDVAYAESARPHTRGVLAREDAARRELWRRLPGYQGARPVAVSPGKTSACWRLRRPTRRAGLARRCSPDISGANACG